MHWQELSVPLYFVPAKVSGLFHSSSPPLVIFASALLNAGYQVSRSHACAGSIKTDAPTSFVFDILREWIKSNPVKMSNVKQNSPTRALLETPQRCVVSSIPSTKLKQVSIS